MMTGEEKKIEQKIQPCRFWFAAVLTAFLAVTFILYLPLRLRHQEMEMVHQEEEMSGAPTEDHHAQTRYHEEGEVREGLAVNMNVTPVPVATGQAVRLDFFVNEKPQNKPVRSRDLELDHGKKMHVIGVRDDLQEFFHIHPEPQNIVPDRPFIRGGDVTEGSISPNQEPLSSPVALTPEEHEALLRRTEIEAPPIPSRPGIFTVFYTFTKPGRYKVWSEVMRAGVRHSFGHPEFAVEGVGTRSEKQVSFGRNVIVGDYQIALRLGESSAAGRDTELLFDVHTLDSFATELEDYLGEKMHLAIIKDDWKQFLHTHPTGEKDHHGMSGIVSEAQANGGGHDTSEGGHGVIFSVTFPEPGLYKAFAQFRPLGIDLPPDEAFTASFWIRAEEYKPLALSRSVLVILSLVLVALVSMAVKKYLTARP